MIFFKIHLHVVSFRSIFKKSFCALGMRSGLLGKRLKVRFRLWTKAPRAGKSLFQNKMELFINNHLEAAFNLALEEVMTRCYPRDFLMLWRNANAIIVGRNQNTAAEINGEKVKEFQTAVIRRSTGGGAVYHDVGNLNYSIAVSGRHVTHESFADHARPVLEALRLLGVPAEFSGRNDILVEGAKISGSARAVLGERTLFHGTLLFDCNMDILQEVLQPDPEKIRSKGIKSVRSRVMNLCMLFPGMSMEKFMEQFAFALQNQIAGCVLKSVPEEFIRRAEKLAEEKYRTWEWNYGTALAYTFSNSKRFPAGRIGVFFNIRNNAICDLAFSGDFFGLHPVEELAEQLNGTSLDPESLLKKIESIPLERWISGISAQELLSLFV